MSRKKFSDFWSWSKAENEKTYTDGYCGHKDRYVSTKSYPPVAGEGWIMQCRSCGANADWNGKDYSQALPKTKLPTKGKNATKTS